jgi:hypothetical protein
MKKIAAAGIAIFALTTAGAYAQTTRTETTTTVQPSTSDTTTDTSTNEPVYKSHRSKTVHSDGSVSEKKDTYSRSNEGMKSSSYRSYQAPDGSQTTTSHEDSVTPDTGVSTERSTTTTTTNPQ